MSAAFFLAYLPVAVVTALVVCIAYTAGRAARRIAKPIKEDPPEPASRWQPLPGGVIELADTGYSITHHPADMRSQYVLITPEGKWLAKCSPGSLAELKAFGELVAGERGEFLATSPADLQSGDDLARALAALRRRGA